MSFLKQILLLAITASCIGLKANNLQISNVSPGLSGISFDISWQNSWHLSTTSNWDAVWIFIKYQDCDSPDKNWTHLLLSSNSADHSISGGVLQVDAVPDGMGVFIRRSSYGSGDISASTVQLTFAGSFSLSVANINFEVLGIEMVYVPEGSFYAGDGSTATPPNSQNAFGNGGSNSAREITSEDALAQNALEHPNMGAPTQHQEIPAAFPKGYAAFYCMKYEVTQNQYVNFLNRLNYVQQAARTAVPVTSAAGTYAIAPSGSPNRNGIKIESPASGVPLNPAVYGIDLNNNSVFNEVDDGGSLACNYLSWNDLLAYLDWAGLRPMTELEFEKVCRGPSSLGLPQLAAYAWNTTNITQAEAGALTNPAEPSEVSSVTGNGLCAYNSSNGAHGPLRTGFAAAGASGREQAGASYYGVMELSGNVWEQCFHVGYNSGSGNGAAPIFEGSHGDGHLSEFGFSNVPDWGDENSVVRSIVRGGNWADVAPYCQISNRHFITSAGGENQNRSAKTGGRGVRTM